MLVKITRDTKAISLCDTGYYRSKIFEKDEKYYSVRSPIALLDDGCIAGGASLEGREVAVRKILNSRSKLPIPVDPENGIYMLPTLSKRNKDCVWLSYYQIDKYEQIDERTLIVFKDGSTIYAKVSEAVLDLQFKRTSQVIAQLNSDKLFGSFSSVQ